MSKEMVSEILQKKYLSLYFKSDFSFVLAIHILECYILIPSAFDWILIPKKCISESVTRKQTVTKYFNELNTTTIKQIQKINFQVRNNDSLNENMSSYLVLFFLLDFTFLKYKFSLV
jgi:hypothetical protein